MSGWQTDSADGLFHEAFGRDVQNPFCADPYKSHCPPTPLANPHFR